MSALVKLAKLETTLITWQVDNLRGVRKFYDDVESNVQTLKNLGIDSKSCGSLLFALVIENLPQDIKLAISRKIETDIWDLTKVLDLISVELRARETCVVPNQLSPSTDCKSEKASIGRISIGWLRILNLEKNFWKEVIFLFECWSCGSQLSKVETLFLL